MWAIEADLSHIMLVYVDFKRFKLVKFCSLQWLSRCFP
jgi:hypothetical protein